AGRFGGSAPHKTCDEILRLVGLCNQASIVEVDDAGAAPAQKPFCEAIAAVPGSDVRLDQRAPAAIGLQAADVLGGTGVRLEEERMKRLEAGRFPELVGGAEDVHAFADVFDGNAFAGEAPDVVQSQR